MKSLRELTPVILNVVAFLDTLLGKNTMQVRLNAKTYYRQENNVLVLASQSPRRQQLLSQLGVEFTIIPANIDESIRPQEIPHDYVQRMAIEKAQANVTQFPNCPIIGADTIVVLENEIFLKPQDKKDFMQMMQKLSGKTHQVLTAVALARQNRSEVIVTDTAVSFRELTAQEIQDYWNTGEPQDKAGGYALQGHAAAFIQSICGSWTGVIGLPLCETLELLKAHDML